MCTNHIQNLYIVSNENFTNLPSKILIVDDEGDICYLLKNALKNTGYVVDHVNTLSQAGVFLKDEKPKVLFLDNRLPDGWGINSIRNIKTEFPELKIIVITGDSSLADRKRAISNGADLFIGKPFTRDQIVEAVKSFEAQS